MNRILLFSGAVLLSACSPSSPSNPTGTDASTESGPSGDAPDYVKMAAGGDCPAASGAGTTHSADVTADETWKAADGPHRVTSSFNVTATLTIEPCAKVIMSPGVLLQIGNHPKVGKLITQGQKTTTALKPVLFVPDDPAKPWGAVVVDSTGSIDLSYTALVGGDEPATKQNGGGALRVYGASDNSLSVPPTLTTVIRSQWTLIQDSAGLGANIMRYAGFTSDSKGFAVRGSKGAFPISMELGAVTSLPDGILLENNTKNEISLEQGWSHTLTHTFHDRGYPYRIQGRVPLHGFADGDVAVMNIEPGVTLRFQKTSDSGVLVGDTDVRQGQIVAKGTADKPITFTGGNDPPAPNDWKGLYFSYYPATGTVLDHTIFEYAGAFSGASGFGCGPSVNDGPILLLNAPTTNAFVTSSTFRNNGGTSSIVLGWAADTAPPDYVNTNTFEASVPACHVAKPQQKTGTACPNMRPDCF